MSLTVTIDGLTPAAIGAGLDFEFERVLNAYDSTAARTAGDPSTRVITASWQPGDDPAPHTVPVVQPNEPGTPEVGTVQMLDGTPLDAEITIRANGQEEGTADATITIMASVQPLKPGTAEYASALDQGKRGYKLYTDTRLNSVETGTPDYMTLSDGLLYEVVSCMEWQNGILDHFEVIVMTKNPIAK